MTSLRYLIRAAYFAARRDKPVARMYWLMFKGSLEPLPF